MKYLDKYLTVWIFMAMLLGLLLGKFIPNWGEILASWEYQEVNIPLAIGLILMMYPPLAKVDYRLLPALLKNTKVLGLSLVLNWIIGPFLMFGLAVLFFADQPMYMTGLILIGLARCIAMVLVWNDLAKGNKEYAAALVALNSLFQLLAYGAYALFFINYLPAWLGIELDEIPEIPFHYLLKTLGIYLGIPLALGGLSRFLGQKYWGKTNYEQKFLPKIGPLTLVFLLFTIVLMFSLKADIIIELPLQVLHLALPLSLYFVLMFLLGFFISCWQKVPYDQNVAISFTAAGNNFELAIVVAIALFGLDSIAAFVAVLGPLIEVPALILLVRLAFYLKGKYYDHL